MPRSRIANPAALRVSRPHIRTIVQYLQANPVLSADSNLLFRCVTVTATGAVHR